MKKMLFAVSLILFVFLAQAHPAKAQAGGAAHLTVYDADVAEFLEERTIELQPGINHVEWRSLMPKAYLRTVRVTAEDAEVVRQDVTYDGPEVRNEKTPVLHLVIRNRAAAGPRRVQVDYLAPNLSWQNDYSLVLAEVADGAAPTAAALDAWVSVQNQTGTDLRAGTVRIIRRARGKQDAVPGAAVAALKMD